MSPETPAEAGAPAPRRELALLFVLATIWSSSFMFIKVAVETISPFALSFGRVALAALVVGGYLAARRDRLPRDARTWAAAALIGLLGNVLPFTLIHWGEQSIDSGLAAILMGVMPVTVAVVAHFADDTDVLTWRRGAGIALGLAGLVVLVGWEAVRGIGTAMVAQLATIAAALSYAATTLLVRRLRHRTGGPMALASLICGAAMLLPLVFLVENPLELAPGWSALLSVSMLGIFSTGVATLMYFRLIRTLGATTFAQINYLIPMMGVAWGVMVLGEQPELSQGLALVLILTGVALVNRPAG